METTQPKKLVSARFANAGKRLYIFLSRFIWEKMLETTNVDMLIPIGQRVEESGTRTPNTNSSILENTLTGNGAYLDLLQDGKLRPHAIKPNQTAIQSGEFEGKTTNKLDYDKKNVCSQRDLPILDIFSRLG